MNKVKFKLKLTGLEMEFEGTRDEMRQISSNFGQQVAGLLQAEVNGKPSDKPEITEDVDADVVASGVKAKKQRKTRVMNGSVKSDKTKAKAVQFKNDPSTYSAPLQKWTGIEKTLWILYVVEAQASITELSAGDIAETFNTHFRQLGPIRPSNVSRDLGYKKGGSDALVGENATVNPSTWYLLEAGKKFVQNLIANQKTNGAN